MRLSDGARAVPRSQRSHSPEDIGVFQRALCCSRAADGDRPRSTIGFNYIVSKFRPEAVAAHVELQKGERSELAELAANIL